MSFVKQKTAAVAATVALFSFSARASNFRGADQVYVPIAAHASGTMGALVTDAFIANLSRDRVDVGVLYVPVGPNEGGSVPRLEELHGKITLLGRERLAFPDIFVNTLGKAPESNALGLLIFSGCLAGFSCGPDTQDGYGYSQNSRPISVQTRLYLMDSFPGTLGHLVTGIPWYASVSERWTSVGLDRVVITGLTHTGNAGQVGTLRSNLGVVNASEYSRTEIVFRLYQGSLSETDLKAEAVRSLGPLGNMQYGFGVLFPGITGSNFFVTIGQRNSTAVSGVAVPATCERGCPAFFAYGVVIDNLSGDFTTLEAQYPQTMDPAALKILYPYPAEARQPRFLRR